MAAPFTAGHSAQVQRTQYEESWR